MLFRAALLSCFPFPDSRGYLTVSCCRQGVHSADICRVFTRCWGGQEDLQIPLTSPSPRFSGPWHLFSSQCSALQAVRMTHSTQLVSFCSSPSPLIQIEVTFSSPSQSGRDDWRCLHGGIWSPRQKWSAPCPGNCSYGPGITGCSFFLPHPPPTP